MTGPYRKPARPSRPDPDPDRPPPALGLTAEERAQWLDVYTRAMEVSLREFRAADCYHVARRSADYAILCLRVRSEP